MIAVINIAATAVATVAIAAASLMDTVKELDLAGRAGDLPECLAQMTGLEKLVANTRSYQNWRVLNKCVNLVHLEINLYAQNSIKLTLPRLRFISGTIEVPHPSVPLDFREILSLDKIDFTGYNCGYILPKCVKHIKILGGRSCCLYDFIELTNIVTVDMCMVDMFIGNTYYSMSKLVNMQNLTHFTNTNSDLKFIPKEFGSLRSLQFLDLSHNSLTSIPDSVFNLPALKEINVSVNKLQTVFNGAKESVIKKANFSQNEITSLPPSAFTGLPLLSSLDLSFNFILELPKTIRCLDELETLNISDNLLDVLPDEMMYLYKLRSLDIRKTRIRELHYGFIYIDAEVKCNFPVTNPLIINAAIIKDTTTKHYPEYMTRQIFDLMNYYNKSSTALYEGDPILHKHTVEKLHYHITSNGFNVLNKITFAMVFNAYWHNIHARKNADEIKERLNMTIDLNEDPIMCILATINTAD